MLNCVKLFYIGNHYGKQNVMTCMKIKLTVIFLIIFIVTASFGGMVSYRLLAKVRFETTTSTPPSHNLWDALMKDFVVDGHVNYKELLKNRERLDIYLIHLQAHVPSANWSREEQLAYWINAYNAFTIKIVLDHFPLNSIKDISGKLQIPLVNTTWDINFIEIGDKKLSLNDIEHRILRKEFNEPAIHFAIVCASVSCPPLRSGAYFADKIDKQLNEQALAFINDKSKNLIAVNHIEISKLFNWFEGDFTKTGSLVDFLNKYAATKINKDAKIDYLDYDWSLND